MKTRDNQKIAIIGSGALGTAMGKVLYDSGYKNLVIYGINDDELGQLQNGQNLKYFPAETKMPSFKTTRSLKEAVSGADYVFMAVPSKIMDKVFEETLSHLDSKVLIVSGSKGFYPNTETSLLEGMNEVAKSNPFVRGVVALIGPSHAEEIVQEMLTIVAVVGFDKKHCEETQEMFSSKYYKVYVQLDVKGAEVGSSYKNILAIASGMTTALGYGINTVAGLLTRGMAEMIVFNRFYGGKPETLMGLTGFGDIIVTATSNLSRNWTFGFNLVNKPEEISTNMTVEGLVALEFVKRIADKNGLDLPIVNFLFKIIHGQAKPTDFYNELWNREYKYEI